MKRKTRAELSEAARNRIAPTQAERSEKMRLLAQVKHSKLTPDERIAHAKMMVSAREAKRKATLS